MALTRSTREIFSPNLIGRVQVGVLRPFFMVSLALVVRWDNFPLFLGPRDETDEFLPFRPPKVVFEMASSFRGFVMLISNT